MIQLKEIKAQDISWFHEINTMDEIRKWINNAPSSWSIDETLEWFYEYNKKRMFGKNHFEYILIAIDENGDKVGYTQLWKHDIMNNKAEVGVMVHPDFQGKGYGKEMLKGTIELATQELRLHKVYSTIREDNLDSLEFFKKFGFVEDGKLRQEIFDGNKYWDFHLLSYISGDKVE